MDRKRGVDEGADESGPGNGTDGGVLATGREDTLEGHVPGRALCTNIEFCGGDLEDAVRDLGTDKTTGLTVPMSVKIWGAVIIEVGVIELTWFLVLRWPPPNILPHVQAIWPR